jgi:hypothetical protein
MPTRISVARGLTASAAVVFLLVVVGAATGAPVPSGTAEVKSAVAPAATEARWGRGYYGRSYRWRRYGSGCHMSGGYHRPSLCWWQDVSQKAFIDQ